MLCCRAGRDRGLLNCSDRAPWQATTSAALPSTWFKPEGFLSVLWSEINTEKHFFLPFSVRFIHLSAVPCCKNWVDFWAAQYKENKQLLESIQRREWVKAGPQHL